jgi:hypothetical protein
MRPLLQWRCLHYLVVAAYAPPFETFSGPTRLDLDLFSAHLHGNLVPWSLWRVGGEVLPHEPLVALRKLASASGFQISVVAIVKMNMRRGGGKTVDFPLLADVFSLPNRRSDSAPWAPNLVEDVLDWLTCPVSHSLEAAGDYRDPKFLTPIPFSHYHALEGVSDLPPHAPFTKDTSVAPGVVNGGQYVLSGAHPRYNQTRPWCRDYGAIAGMTARGREFLTSANGGLTSTAQKQFVWHSKQAGSNQLAARGAPGYRSLDPTTRRADVSGYLQVDKNGDNVPWLNGRTAVSKNLVCYVPYGQTVLGQDDMRLYIDLVPAWRQRFFSFGAKPRFCILPINNGAMGGRVLRTLATVVDTTVDTSTPWSTISRAKFERGMSGTVGEFAPAPSGTEDSKKIAYTVPVVSEAERFPGQHINPGFSATKTEFASRSHKTWDAPKLGHSSFAGNPELNRKLDSALHKYNNEPIITSMNGPTVAALAQQGGSAARYLYSTVLEDACSSSKLNTGKLHPTRRRSGF